MPADIPVYLHLLRAKDLIERDYVQPLDVPALARAAHASTAHFSRSFKSAFGETPRRYLQRRRIERAQELLRGTDLLVTEVSIEVGFRSLGSFSAAFRDLVGEPPSAYATRCAARERRRSPPVRRRLDAVEALGRLRRWWSLPGGLTVSQRKSSIRSSIRTLILLEIGPPMMDADTAEQVRGLIAMTQPSPAYASRVLPGETGGLTPCFTGGSRRPCGSRAARASPL
jgi:AraC-like DNA-binding protein